MEDRQMMGLVRLWTANGWILHGPKQWSSKFSNIIRMAQKGVNINLVVWC